MINKFFNYLRFKRWYYFGRFKIKNKIKKAALNGKVKVIIGSATTNYEGWIPTDLPHFDITKKKDWYYFFNKHKANNLLAEHVLEHISEKKVIDVFNNAIDYLVPGGVFRIAIPDGFNPDKEYIDNVKPNGNHPEWGHQALWTYIKIKEIVPEGFNLIFKEYFNEKGEFHSNLNSFENGNIQRCNINYLKNNTSERSLIIDLIKK